MVRTEPEHCHEFKKKMFAAGYAVQEVRLKTCADETDINIIHTYILPNRTIYTSHYSLSTNDSIFRIFASNLSYLDLKHHVTQSLPTLDGLALGCVGFHNYSSLCGASST